jgi:5-methylcytosine-specific restriction endonuclease McrA
MTPDKRWRVVTATAEVNHGLVMLRFDQAEKGWGGQAFGVKPTEVDGAHAGTVGARVRPFATVKSHPSKLVTPKGNTYELTTLRSKALRIKLYGGWTTAADNHRAKLLKQLQSVISAADRALLPPAWAARAYECPVCKVHKDPQSTSDPFTLDHVEAVSVHWNKPGGGHDQTQADRTKWYNELTNLEPMCFVCNRKKGGDTYDIVVGPNFLGPGE